jgi:exosortase H (IPTLxxWG-CTERM-specific)
MRRFAVLFVVILLALFALELTPPGQAALGPWTDLVAKTSSAVIRAFDGEARAQGNMVYSTRTGFAMTIMAGCNGVEAMLVLLAGILAFPAPWKWKLVGLGVGVVAIQALNLVRIVSLFYLGQWDMKWFEWAHLYAWQALIMLDAMVVWLLWMRSIPERATATPEPAAAAA